jgi:hypothetical protein
MVEQKAQVVDFQKERERKEKALSFDEHQSLLPQSTGVTPQHFASESLKEEIRAVTREEHKSFLESLRKEGLLKPHARENRHRQVQGDTLNTIKINFLWNKNLRMPIDATLERDGEGFIARTLEIPLYGYGEDAYEAIAILKREIESLYDDLMEDDNLSDEWMKVKDFLRQIVE